jgi:hypothetical protein
MSSTQFPPASTSYPLSFDTVAHSFVLSKKLRALESGNSALFAQNTRGCGVHSPSVDTLTDQVLSLLSHTCNPCTFMQLRTLSRNGAKLSLPFSVASALFLSQRGCAPDATNCSEVRFRFRTRHFSKPRIPDFRVFSDRKEVTETTQNRSLQQTPRALYTFQPIEY